MLVEAIQQVGSYIYLFFFFHSLFCTRWFGNLTSLKTNRCKKALEQQGDDIDKAACWLKNNVSLLASQEADQLEEFQVSSSIAKKLALFSY